MTAPVVFASVLGPIITRYLALKRALGQRADSPQYILSRLDRFLASHDAKDLDQSFVIRLFLNASIAERTGST